MGRKELKERARITTGVCGGFVIFFLFQHSRLYHREYTSG